MNGGMAGGLAPPSERRVNIVAGEFYVTDDDGIYLTTILGSCVAACLTDPMARVGGMNHFLLPGGDMIGNATQQGAHPMDLLLQGLLLRGARRERLQAKLFGGARMLDGLSDVGRCNAEFAEEFIRRERIAFTGGSLRGEQGRRVEFWPITGRVRQLTLGRAEGGEYAPDRPGQAVHGVPGALGSL